MLTINACTKILAFLAKPLRELLLSQNTYVGVGNSEPAVAALVAGDRSSFYRCGFVSVQDTLSDLLGRHYYEGCYIEGAIDFIFGYGQSIFQVLLLKSY